MSDGRAASGTHDEPLPPEEFARRLAEIRERLTDEEAEASRDLARWFLQRYPTLVERCRYATRKHRELTAAPQIARTDLR